MKTIKKLFFILAPLFILFSLYLATRDGQFQIEAHKDIEAPAELIDKEIPGILRHTRSRLAGLLNATILSGTPENARDIPPGTAYLSWKIDDTTTTAIRLTYRISGTRDFSGKFKALLGLESGDQVKDILMHSLDSLDLRLRQMMNEYSITPLGVTEYSGGFFVANTTTCTFDEIPARMDEMLPAVLFYCIGKEFPISGHPFTLYHRYDEAEKTAEFSCCVPVSERVTAEGDFNLGYMERGTYFKTRLKGSYRYSDEAWRKAFDFARKEGIEIDSKGKPFEVYVAGHSKSPNPADWITDIYLPVK